MTALTYSAVAMDTSFTVGEFDIVENHSFYLSYTCGLGSLR